MKNEELAAKGRSGGRREAWTWALLFFLAVAVCVSCQQKKAEAALGASAVDSITLNEVKAVLGTANDFASGVLDVTQGNEELIIAYRYYDADLQNFETDFATEIAPRVQALYKRFKSLDRVRFQVTANTASARELWQPFTEFALDRKTVEEIRWTGFLAKYILDLVLKNKRWP